MKTMTFKSVKEWMETNPNADEQAKVLNLINKQAYRELRFEIMKKEANLKKINKTESFLIEHGFNADQNFKLRKKELENEIMAIRKQLHEAKK